MNQGRSYWPDIINYYEGTTYGNQVAAGVTNPVYPSGTPIKTHYRPTQHGLGPNSSGQTLNNGGGTLGALNTAFLPMAIPELSSYLPNLGNTAGFADNASPELSTTPTFFSGIRASSTSTSTCSTAPTSTSGRTGRPTMRRSTRASLTIAWHSRWRLTTRLTPKVPNSG